MTNCVSQNQKKGEMQITTIPKKPFDILYINFGPLQQIEDNFKFVFIVVDAFTRFAWLHSMKSTSSKEAIDFLKLLFNIFRLPKEVISDRGIAFTCREFDAMINLNNIVHHKVAIVASWVNGIMERVNRFLKSTLQKLVDEPLEAFSVKLRI